VPALSLQTIARDGYLWRRAACALLLAASAACLPVAAQAPSAAQIDGIAAELADRLLKSKDKPAKGQPPPKVVILPFPLADEIAGALQARATEFAVADREPALNLIRQLKLPPRALAHDGVAAWLGWKTGAQLVVSGQIGESGDRVRLDLAVIRVRGAENRAQLRREFPRTSETLALLASARPPRRLRVGEPPASDDGEPIYQPGRNGIGAPQCAWCPNPSFTEEGVRWLKRYNGVVILRLVITAQGTAKDLEVEQGAPCGLTEQAIAAIRQWRFEPAKDADGNPVAVRTSIEVSFRSL